PGVLLAWHFQASPGIVDDAERDFSILYRLGEHRMESFDTVTYQRGDCVVFCKTKEAFGGLSNMAAGDPLDVNGLDILTSEALYQACRFPQRPDVQKMILAERSPMGAKMRSKPYRTEHTRRDWEQVNVVIMHWCLRVKLAQNWKTFGDLLLS